MLVERLGNRGHDDEQQRGCPDEVYLAARSDSCRDWAVPDELGVHLICDNYATHKHQSVRAWLDKHPRFQLHFTPTSSSWLNLVERWFRELTDKALRRGVFHSVPDLIAKIEDYLAAHNNDPKPFVWTATAQDILAKVARGRIALQAVNQ